MTEEKKRLTPAETRSQQEQREKDARDARELAQQESRMRIEQEMRQREQTLADGIKRTWYEKVQEAAKRDGIRFVVLAEVVEPSRVPVVAEIIELIAADGYECKVVNVQATGPGGRTKVLDEKIENEVVSGGEKGLMPANVPRIGTNGGISYLIVKW